MNVRLSTSTQPDLPRGYAAQAQGLLGTAKWLAASAGAIAAALVAGLQLTSIAGLGTVAALIAVGGVVAALVAVAAALAAISRVLAAERPTVSEISNEEIAAGLLETGSVPEAGSLAQYPLVEWIQQRRTSLLGEADSLTNLYMDGVIHTGRAAHDLRHGRRASWSGKSLKPGRKADLEWIEARYREAVSHVLITEEAAGYWKIRAEYRTLLRKRWFVWLFIVGVLAFALAPAWTQDKGGEAITSPVNVTVYLDAKDASLPEGCPDVLTGQAVGGTLDAPVVVSAPQGKCPPRRIYTTGLDVVVYQTEGTGDDG